MGLSKQPRSAGEAALDRAKRLLARSKGLAPTQRSGTTLPATTGLTSGAYRLARELAEHPVLHQVAALTQQLEP